MKLSIVLFIFFNMYISHPDLQVYRKLMDQSVENKKVAGQFYERLKTVKEDADPAMLGFKAMSEFMLCKHLFNPISRLSHFNRGRNLLEMAIQRDNQDPELRYFRLSTQSNVPSVLGYNNNIKADKQMLLVYLKKGAAAENEDVYCRIKSYLLINQHCTAQEKELIKNL